MHATVMNMHHATVYHFSYYSPHDKCFQIEIPQEIRHNSTLREPFIADLASAIASFVEMHYGLEIPELPPTTPPPTTTTTTTTTTTKKPTTKPNVKVANDTNDDSGAPVSTRPSFPYSVLCGLAMILQMIFSGLNQL